MQDPGPAVRYDPSSVLQSLAQTGVGDVATNPFQESIQNVVNQLLAGAQPTTDLGQGSF